MQTLVQLYKTENTSQFFRAFEDVTLYDSLDIDEIETKPEEKE